MAALRQLSPRFWLTATLGSLIAVSAAALWWEQQLPSRLTKALDRGDYEACIRAGEQLAALRWLGEGAPDEQALCRQRQAEQLWREGETTEALALQQKLVMSKRGDLKQNRDTLQSWEKQLQDKAVAVFRQGDLNRAMALLEPMQRRSDGKARQLSYSLREIWNRNQLERKRLDDLVGQERWWEALDSLNRLDHPWWQTQAGEQRERIEAAINVLGDAQEHHQHPVGNRNGITGSELEQAVQDQLRNGVDPWDAFEAGCRSLGGLVVEDGPESFCRPLRAGSVTK